MSSPTVSTKLQWIAEQAVREPGRVFTTLAHLIDIDFLKEAFNRTRKDEDVGDVVESIHFTISQVCAT